MLLEEGIRRVVGFRKGSYKLRRLVEAAGLRLTTGPHLAEVARRLRTLSEV